MFTDWSTAHVCVLLPTTLAIGSHARRWKIGVIDQLVGLHIIIILCRYTYSTMFRLFIDVPTNVLAINVGYYNQFVTAVSSVTV